MFSTDWAIMETAASDLESYLLAKDLYWLVKGGRLSPGNILLSQARLRAVPQNLDRLEPMAASIEQTRAHWRSAWKDKADREFGERLRLWRQYLADTGVGENTSQTEYKTQVRLRAMLQLLSADLGLNPQNELELGNLDEKLRLISRAGNFVWQSVLAPGFAKEEYWFLYCRLISELH